ncbi:MAG: hypothetical protein GY828_07885 [Candidatus Gracilibacteria bacterium]|nr:hypothetical protein [Candidatus Gracilibacteria bacterium]
MEFDILFARTFLVVGAMLILTAVGSGLNKNNVSFNSIVSLVILIALLYISLSVSDTFPLNIVLISVFSLFMGWIISPAIQNLGENFKTRKFLKTRNISLKKDEILSEEQMNDLEGYLIDNKSDDQWNKIIAQAMFSTALAIISTASLVFMSDIDFSFLGMFLFIALLILIIMGLINFFVFKSRIFTLIKAYCGVLIFTGYLIYDFDTLEKMAGDESWSTAIHLAINLYLDIINLFLYILEILSEG